MDIIRRKPITQPAKNPWPANLPAHKKFQPTQLTEPVYVTRPELEKIPAPPSPARRRPLWGKFLRRLLLLILTIFLALGFFLAWKTYAVSKKISIGPDTQTSFSSDMQSLLGTLIPNSQHKPLRGEEAGRINILLLGAAGEKKPGQNLTDTVMVMSIDTKNKKMALLSLPRDLYVQIPQTQTFTKLNSLYQLGLSTEQGLQPIQEAVTKITALPIQYYLVVNFDGFEKFINDIGGVNVTVERDIYDPRYPGPNYSYQTFELKKGFHSLDGATALKYVRERHDDPQGDFGRAKRQQQVIQAAKNKVFSAQTLLNVVALNNLLNTLGDNIKTNIPLEDLEGFLSLAKQLDTQNINNVVVDAWQKDSLLKVSHVQVGATRAFILVPRVGSYSEIQDVAANIFDRSALEKRTAQIQSEQASVLLINQSSDPFLANKIRQLLTEKLGFTKVQIYAKAGNEKKMQSAVVDLSGSSKIYSLDELVKKIPAKLTAAETVEAIYEKNDFVVLLGEDAADNYRYEEDSIEEYNKSQEDNNLEF